MDRHEQERWSGALFLGGLPWIWGQVPVMRDLIFAQLELRRGDRVFVMGEDAEKSGFIQGIAERIGPAGEVIAIDIQRVARDAYAQRARGSGGQIATWKYEYVRDERDESFDAIAVLQAVQHAEDWDQTAREFVRVLKGGRKIVLAEVAFGPSFAERAKADVHLEYLLEKIFSRMKWHYSEFPYYSVEELKSAFVKAGAEVEGMEWRGIELLWARKRDAAASLWTAESEVDSGGDIEGNGRGREATAGAAT